MNKKIFLLSLLLFSMQIFGQAKIDSLIATGIKNIYSFSFDKAEKNFNSALLLNKNLSRPYYYLARINLLKYLGCKDEEFRKTFFRYIELAKKVNSELLDEHETEKELLTAGKIFLDISTAQAYNLDIIDAFWSARKASSYFDDVLELNPNNIEAKVNLAVLGYSLSSVSGFYSFVMNLAGLDHNENDALEQLLSAKEIAKESNPELDFHLGVVYSTYFAEYGKALLLFEKLTKTYPENIFFSYQYAKVNFLLGHLETSKKTLNKVIATTNNDFVQTEALADFLMGEIKFVQNNFPEAMKFYHKFISKSIDNNFFGLVSLRVAICCYAANDQTNLEKNLRESNLGNEDLDEDEYAMNMGKQYLQHGFNEEDFIIWKTRNNYLSGKFSEVIKFCETEDKNLYLTKNKWLLFYYVTSLIKLDQNDKAFEVIRRVKSDKKMYKGEFKDQVKMLSANLFLKQKKYEDCWNEISGIGILGNYTDFGYKISDKLKIERYMKELNLE